MTQSFPFSESHGMMVLTKDGDYNAGFTADSIDFSNFDHIVLWIIGDSSCAGDGVLTLYAAATNAGTTASVTFSYRVTAVAVGTTASDVYAAPSTAATTLTLTGASLAAQYNYVIEVDASDMCVSGVQYRYLTPTISAAGTAGTVDVLAIGDKPRVAKAIMATAV